MPVTLDVKVTPRSSKSEVVSFEGALLKVRLHSPPDKGKANEELISVLSEFFHTPKSSISLVKGMASRSKRVVLNNVSFEEIEPYLKKLKSSF